MATSTDISMPREAVPVFPDSCVVCLGKADSTARIAQHSQNPLGMFFVPFLLLFGWSRVECPVCSGCKLRFYAERWGRTAVCWTIVGLSVYWIMPYFKTWDPTMRKIVVAAICLLIALPYFSYEVFFPRSFDTTANATTTTYEFRSQELGLRFFALNKQRYPHAKIDLMLGD